MNSRSFDSQRRLGPSLIHNDFSAVRRACYDYITGTMLCKILQILLGRVQGSMLLREAEPRSGGSFEPGT